MKSFRIALVGLLAILLLPALAAAQSLPSPSYKNLTVSGALSAPGVGPFVVGANLTGSVDTRAQLVAADTAPFIIPPGIYRVSSNLTISHDVTFQPGAVLSPDSGVTVTLSGQISAPLYQQIFSGAGKVAATNAKEVWTSWWGAIANASTDAAPAFRAAMGSNRIVRSVPSTYLFCSTVSAGPYNSQYFPAAVWPAHFTSFTIDNTSSIFNVCNAQALSAFIFFDQNTYARLEGGTYNGNHTGLATNAEAVGIVTWNQQNGIFQNFFIGGNFGGLGAGIAGDYIVNSKFNNIVMSGVGQAVDVAFVVNTGFDHLVAVGSDVAGTGTGSKGFSIIQDLPSAVGDNHTGLTIPTNSGVTLTNSSISNFNSCEYWASGNTLKSIGNHLYNCAGNSGGAQGIGIQISYEINSSEGYPVTDFLSTGDTIANNGSVTAGAGVSIDNNVIVNSDVMSNIKVNNATISNNNATGVRANAAGTAHLQNIDVTTGNIFNGAAQTNPVNSNIPAIQSPPPVTSSCNSGTVSANSTNASGTVTEGAGSGGCVLSFAKKQANYPQLPTCFVWPIGTPSTAGSFGWSVASVTNGATLTITNATTDTRNYGYHCSGN